jgi:hypothetical protein
VGLGLLWLAVPLAVFLTASEAILAGHPAYVTALAVAGLIGVVLLVRAWGDDGDAPRRPRWMRLLGGVVTVLLSVAMLGALVWLRPLSATPEAIAAMGGTREVMVADTPAHIVLTPTASPPTRGLIFQPGARIDPRAYVPILMQVSRSGVLVVIVKQPLDLGLLARGAPDAVIEAHPQITSWALSGHSLGGTVAAEYAREKPGTVHGLVLWASYPQASLAADSTTRIASVSGSLDGIATPEEIDESMAKLPAETAYTVVQGAVHSSFGDYGQQPGDGTPTITKPDAQRQIVTATVSFLDSLPVG